MSDLEEQSGGASEGKERTRGRRQVRAGRAAGRTRGGRRGRRGGHRSYRDRSRSQERPRRSTRSGQGRGRGRLMPEVGSQQRIADHEVQLQVYHFILSTSINNVTNVIKGQVKSLSSTAQNNAFNFLNMSMSTFLYDLLYIYREWFKILTWRLFNYLP